MVETMNYSAGMVSQVFAFVETKQTAELMAAGMSKDEIKDKVILGEKTIEDRDINGFFGDKAAQSEEVAGW